MIVGAGPVGTALAARLAREGHRVRLISRSGRDPRLEGVEALAADASDPAGLSALAEGAEAIYNCANPGSYPAWEPEWPPLATAILSAAESAGAVLVTMSNLYGYGPVSAPITRSTPLNPSDHKGALRARMWEEALAAHEAGRVRVAEARASDYIGPTLPKGSGLLAMIASASLRGRIGWVLSDPDQPHTWTAVDDAAATLALLARDERAWGSAWLVPSAPAQSVREVLRALNERVGAGEPRLRRMPRTIIRIGGAVIPMLREVTGVLYQFDAPFIADGGETTEAFGLAPSDWDALLDETASAWLRHAQS